MTKPNAAKAVVAVKPAFDESASNIVRSPLPNPPIFGASDIGRGAEGDPWSAAKFS